MSTNANGSCGFDAMDGAFQFATSMRSLALDFIRKAKKNPDFQDTPESAGPLLDLVGEDVIRIQDPAFHPKCEVVPGMNWDEARRAEVVEICTRIFSKDTP